MLINPVNNPAKTGKIREKSVNKSKIDKKTVNNSKKIPYILSN